MKKIYFAMILCGILLFVLVPYVLNLQQESKSLSSSPVERLGKETRKKTKQEKKSGRCTIMAAEFKQVKQPNT